MITHGIRSFSDYLNSLMEMFGNITAVQNHHLLALLLGLW